MRWATAALTALLIALSGCGGGDDGSTSPKKQTATTPAAPQITIGTKNFPEQFVLGELYKQALEANGFRVRLKSDIGSSEIVDRALIAAASTCTRSTSGWRSRSWPGVLRGL